MNKFLGKKFDPETQKRLDRWAKEDEKERQEKHKLTCIGDNCRWIGHKKEDGKGKN